MSGKISDPWELTPVQESGGIWLKRDDSFELFGASGGKVRACWVLSQGATGLITGSDRTSPQQQIVSRIAEHMGIPCRVHTASGSMTAEMSDAAYHGAEIIQHKMGYSATLSAKAKKDAARSHHTLVPFGMESALAIKCTRNQVRNLPTEISRIVIIVGSGISTAGILWGLRDRGLDIPILGIRVGGGVHGSSIVRRLSRFAPCDWGLRLEIVQAKVPYQKSVQADWCGIELDGHYEAKARDFLREGDLFWIVGKRPKITNTDR